MLSQDSILHLMNGTKRMRRELFRFRELHYLLGGPDAKWAGIDENPPRFYEPLPSGPYKGKTTNIKEVGRMNHDYYKELGWDEKGIPKSDTLKKLGLEKLDKILKNKLT